MKRSLWTSLAVLAAAVAVASPAAAATPPLRSSTVVDDLGLPLRGWSVSGRPELRQVRLQAPNRYAIDGRALRLAPGGSIARTLAERPWSLSVDARVPRGSTLRVDLGGPPVTLRKRSNGSLEVASGDIRASLPAGSAGPARWHHVAVAGFDPVQLHVDGTRIPNDIDQARGIRLRTLRGAVQLIGLIATRRDDRRALLLHRLAGIHARTPANRFPVRTGPDGVLRFERGRDDGFYAGALWNAYGLTGARLFRDWGEHATFEKFEQNDHRDPPAHWQGLRHVESYVAADRRTCSIASPAHRCRLLRKATGSAGVYGMTNGNPGTFAIPSLLWPRLCPSCQSSDEVEIRIETMMDSAAFEWSHVLHEHARRARPHLNIVPSPFGPRSIEHAQAVARLLVRGDGSTAEGVRTNRLDGTVLSYEGGFGNSPGGTWARGHAGAIYGFARTGLLLENRELVGVAERAARYLEVNLPVSRIPPHDFAAPDGPSDPEAGALYAAGLLRLAAACEGMAGACADGPRWRTLGASMLDAVLARLNPHLPVGAIPEGDTLMGIDFALEAVERSAG